MIRLPSQTYFLTEDSPAVEILEELGVVFDVDDEGQRAVQLDPILMIAILALQGKYYPTVSSLIELWKNQEENPNKSVIKKQEEIPINPSAKKQEIWRQKQIDILYRTGRPILLIEEYKYRFFYY